MTTVNSLVKNFLENKEAFNSFEAVYGAASQIAREIYIGDIDSVVASNVEATIRIWNRADAEENIPVESRKPIKIYIDSYGGELVAAFTIINAIELSKTPVYTINAGAAYSAGFFIFLAGHKRFSYSLSSFLFHEGSTGTVGDAHKFRNFASFYDTQLKLLKQHTLKYTKFTEEDYTKFEKDDYWLTADEALERGVCDVVLRRDDGNSSYLE